METKKIYGDWIKWGGNECPVSPDTLVKIKMRDGVVLGPDYAASFLWRQGHGTGDIVEYCTAAHTDIDAAEQLLRGNGYTVIPPLTFEDVTPIMEAPEEGTEYWVVSLSDPEGVIAQCHTGRSFYEQLVIKRGMAYLKKEHALIAARHIFGLKGR